MARAREYNHDRPLLNTSVCEHGHCLGIVGVYEGDSFADPACVDSRGKPKSHVATQKKYTIDKGWQADYDKHQTQLAALRKARAERKTE